MKNNIREKRLSYNLAKFCFLPSIALLIELYTMYPRICIPNVL